MLRKNPKLTEDWLAVLDEFRESADEIIASTVSTWWGRGAQFLHKLLNPASLELHAELDGLCKYLGTPVETMLAGQLVYDAALTGGIDATCGCTSMAMLHQGRPWHGRLLDWTWPTSISGRIQKVLVRNRGRDFYMEHIPGCTGFTGAWNTAFAANLNQAPHSDIRYTSMPALWWFRRAIEKMAFLRPTPPPGGMTDALVHVTHRSGETSRIYYVDGKPLVDTEQLTAKPVVLTNTYDSEDIEEDVDGYKWSKWRQNAINKSRTKKPLERLHAAECEATVFAWGVGL